MGLFLAAVVAVGLMMLGLSITLIRKGRNLQGDVGDNDDMKRMGLTCASAEARREDAILRGEDPALVGGCSSVSCSTCATCDEGEQDACGQK